MRCNYYLIFFLLLSGCKSSTEKKTDKEPAAPAAKQAGTQKMAERLQYIQAHFSVEDNAFLNNARADFFKNQMDATTDQISKGRMFYYYAMELLNAGRTKEAIEATEQLIKMTEAQENNITEDKKPLFDLLGIAYMRLGEQDNCIMNHNGYSCIVPLQNPAIHQMKTGSTKAAEVFKHILEKFPQDLSSVWLLNLAYMTLGEYPKSVPEKWRIPESAFASKGKIPRFENIATLLGIDANSHAGGCCVEDFNGDGYLDIMASSWNLTDQVRFFINNGDGSFTDKTTEAGLAGETGGLNMTHADYNNDGFPDIFILRGGWMNTSGNQPKSLLKNMGNGKFEDVTVEAGIYSEHPTQTASWADFNMDGFLDVFIGHESGDNFTNPCEMYFNNGNGTFTEVAKKLGLDVIGMVKGCSSGDVDHNGLPDLYLSVFGGENKLFMNRGGTNIDDWKFEEAGAKAGVQQPHWSFPTWFFDYDNDGWDDIFVCGYDFPRFIHVGADEVLALTGRKQIAELPRLYHNNRDGTFEDVTKEAGVSRVMYAMGSNFGDINNDGYLDFYIGTGVPNLKSIVPNRMWLNQKGKSFTDVTNDGGFGNIQKGHGVGFGDLDNDGDNDIYEVIGGAYEGDNFRNALFNNPGNKNNWIVLKLTGTKSNRTAVGAVIRLEITENGTPRTIYRTVNTGGSFGASSLQLEIGLGSATVVNTLDVTWPNKEQTHQSFKNIEAGKKYLLTEGGELTPAEYKTFQWKLKEPHHQHHQM
ncbi:MAG TPA: CRTAC1 family protein [Bacteroidia bacterium]|nr:CRTAC1 family protein [Bacteroidia bacterium]